MRLLVFVAAGLLVGCPNPPSAGSGSTGSSSTGSGSSSGTSGSGSTGSSGTSGSSSGSSGSSGTTGCVTTGLHCVSSGDCCSGNCQGNVCYAAGPSCSGNIGDTCYAIDFPGCCTGQCVMSSDASFGNCCKDGVSVPCTSDADCCGAAPYDLAGRTVCGTDGQCTLMRIPPDAGSACVGLGSGCDALGCCSGLTCGSDGLCAPSTPDAGCPAHFCDCTCTNGDAGYRPQCGYVAGQGCVASDPCISGLWPDGGWAVCGL